MASLLQAPFRHPLWFPAENSGGRPVPPSHFHLQMGGDDMTRTSSPPADLRGRSPALRSGLLLRSRSAPRVTPTIQNYQQLSAGQECRSFAPRAENNGGVVPRPV